MNAIYELVTRESKFPSAPLTYRVGVGVALLIAAYLTWETLNRWPEHLTFGAQWYGLALFVLLMLPAYMSAVSAFMTVEHARRIDFVLLQTTPIMPREVVWGFVRGALFRSRVVLALTIPLWPLVTIGSLQAQIQRQFIYFVDCSILKCGSLEFIGTRYGWYSYPELTYGSLFYGALAVLGWASSLAGASVGVYFALKNRNPILAPLAAIAVTLLCLLLPAIGIIFELPLGGVELQLVTNGASLTSA